MNIRDDFILKNIHEGYVVGGFIRDFFLKEDNELDKPLLCDRDITIKNAKIFAEKLSKTLNATFIILDEANQIFRLVLKDKINYLDISELRGNSIERDLLERDFTINAIAYDLSKDEFIDITGGFKDIKQKKLRSIKEQNFIDDPLRIIRAYRFMATTGFEADKELIQILKKHLSLINNPAKERIHDEIMKLFGGKYTSKTLLKMLNDGILEVIFPCVSEMKQIPKNSHHHLDLIHHVIETVKQIENQYAEADGFTKEHLDNIDFGGYPRINHLKLAGFLHDIGKFSTWTLEKAGITVWKNGEKPISDEGLRHRFIKHDIKGAEIAVPILKNLKFSNKQIEYIQEMIKKHIYPSSVISSPILDKKVLMRYVRKMGDNVIDNIFLAKADRLSAQGPDVTKKMTEANIKGLNILLQFYLEVKDTLTPLPKLIDGNEIMKILNIKPSSILGEIIENLKESQINGEIVTKEDAENFVKNYPLT